MAQAEAGTLAEAGTQAEVEAWAEAGIQAEAGGPAVLWLRLKVRSKVKPMLRPKISSLGDGGGPLSGRSNLAYAFEQRFGQVFD